MLTAYKIYSKSTKLGRGLGGSVLAEFIDCGGLFGVIFWTFILSAVLVLCENFKVVPNIIKPFVFSIMVSMFHAPRGYFLAARGGISTFLVELLVYYILFMFCKYFRSKNDERF